MQAQATPKPESPHRRRLVEGMTAAIVEKGYAGSTIADIVRHAGVSKRTFYEHFPDKEACFLASYAAASDEALRVIEAAAAPGLSWEERVRAGVRAYLRVLEEQPALTRTYLLEIHAAGPGALRMRREVHDRFAAQLRRLAQAAREEEPALRPLSRQMATALVGGIHELVLVALEKGRPQRLGRLAGTAVELIRAALTSAPASAR